MVWLFVGLVLESVQLQNLPVMKFNASTRRHCVDYAETLKTRFTFPKHQCLSLVDIVEPEFMLVTLNYIPVDCVESIQNNRNYSLAFPILCWHALKILKSKVYGATTYISPHWAITTSVAGFSPRVRVFSTLRMTSIPSTTFPKTTCLLLRKGVGTVITKNWQPLVLGPEFWRKS